MIEVNADISAQFDKRARLHEKLAGALAAEIVGGRWDENAVVPSAEDLATRFGVSRTVGRETLQALASAGLITVRHGRRTTVAPMHEWKFMDDLVRSAVARGDVSRKVAADLWEARIVLEEFAIRWCTRRADVALAADLEEVARDQVTLASSDPQPLNEIAACDLKFHFFIAQGSGNKVLSELISGLRQQLVSTWAMDEGAADEHRLAATEHLAIATAVRLGNAADAVSTLRHHLRRGASIVLDRRYGQARIG